MRMNHPKTPIRVLTLTLLLPLLPNSRGNYLHSPSPMPSLSTLGGVWPLPQKQELQDEYVSIVDSFKFKIVGKSCATLDDAVTRYTALLGTNWRHLTKYDLVDTAPNIVGKISKLKIRLMNPCEKYPHMNMDEKYTLEINKHSSTLQADNIWGILRGLETFSQLPAPAPNEEQLIIRVQKIEDFPQYPHRGLLIDTGRHYLSVRTIKKQLDIMSYNKMNVLHWHIVDDQSFPYQSKKFPALSQKGSFGPDALYTEAHIKEIIEYATLRGIRVIPEFDTPGEFGPDALNTEANIKEIIEYATLRGIRVIPEFDTPGHTDSMEPGMPDLNCHTSYPVTGKTFIGPLDPTKNSTFEFIHDLLTEVYERFPDGYVHLGGDEVDSYCWSQDSRIKSFMDTRKWSSSQLQSYYMQKVLQDVKAMSLKAIVWEEVFNNRKSHDRTSTGLMDSLDKEHKDFPIVQMWKEYDASCVKAVAQKGYNVITSCGWYLDYLDQDFWKFYDNDFRLAHLTADESKFVLGGEACMWGEKADDTNIEPRVWPRTCAIAEHLWSAPHEKTSNDTSRITEHVCRLRRRDVQAAPISISYCTETLPKPAFGGTGRFFTMNSIKETLGLDQDDDDDVKYEMKSSNDSNENSKESEKSAKSITAEKLTPLAADGKSSADALENNKSAAVGAGTSLLLVIWSLAALLKFNL